MLYVFLLITNMMYVSSYYCRVTAHFPFQRRSLHHHGDHRSLRASLHTGHEVLTEANPKVLTFDMTKEKIRKMFKNVEISVSSYDTAWVAMVPSPNSPNSPCFPECVNWLMDNQLGDGSWGLVPYHPTLLKEALSSTLACVIALKRWNVGEDQINKGMCFIESKFASVADENQRSPFGFDIIFPGMLEYAKDLNLNFPLLQKDVNVMLHERELEIMRCLSQERKPYLAYISEGLGDFYDRDMVMKYQMKNGSLFNSPSATAAALVHHHDAGCVNYLTSVLKKFGNAVPTVYSLDIYGRLCMVDALTSLGITRHFREEIQNVLDETYRCWVQGDEQIFMDVATCALAFRLLRTNGYEVSSDQLAEISKEEAVLNSDKEPFKDVYSAIELYKASQIMYQQELDFGKQKTRSMEFLERKISNVSIRSDMSSKYIQLQVDNALRFPFHDSLERISTRRNIQNYNVDNNIRTLKTTFRSLNISNKEYLKLAVEDFNVCQSIHREELKDLEKWVVTNRLEELKFVRQKTAYCYFSAALTFPYPELSDARISWTKSAILTGVVDDFFDVGGSLDELVNLIQCVEKWNVNADNDCFSKEVRIIFLALKDTVLWIGERALKRQKRSVTSHVIETWLTLMQTMLKEAVWSRDNSVPTMNEYMENGYVTIALGPMVLPSLYFVGPELSEEIVHSSEYHNLFELTSIQGRLLNDIQSYERELKAGKLNAVTLHTRNGNSGITEEEVVKEIKMFVNDKRKELMRLVVQGKGSIVPKACKDVFWSMCNVLNLFYATNDGYSGNDILEIVKEIIYEPVFPKADY